jgi:Flp pilus assembly protein TadG
MASITKIVRRFWVADSGAELIELAIALPILLLVTAGIVDLGIVFQRYEVVTNAAREGARVGVLADFTETDIQNRVIAYLKASGMTAAAPAPKVTYSTIPIVVGGPSIQVVKVAVQYPHQFVFLGPAAALVGGTSLANITLAASATMRREGAAAP